MWVLVLKHGITIPVVHSVLMPVLYYLLTPHWTSGQVLLVSLSSCLLNAVMTDEHMQSLGGHGVMRFGFKCIISTRLV